MVIFPNLKVLMYLYFSAAKFEGDTISQAPTGITEMSPPVTPHTILSGPYIPISECISGKPINNDEDLKQFLLLYESNRTTNPCMAPITTIPTPVTNDSYDLPRNLKPPEINADTTPPPSPGSESVFTDDESMLHKPMAASSLSKKPHVNWETFPRPSDSSMDVENSPDMLYSNSNAVTMRADRVFAKAPPSSAGLILAPPRPPKPSHLVSNESQLSNNQRTEENTKIVTTSAIVSSPGSSNTDQTSSALVPEPSQDQTYDVPRSHLVVGHGSGNMPKKSTDSAIGAAGFSNCYSNMALGCKTSEINNIFRYDFAVSATNSDKVAGSPNSVGSISFANSLTHSALSSPSLSMGGSNQLVSTPPAVNRDLKPGFKWSDSTNGSNEPSPVLMGYPRPIIDRNRKPMKSSPWKKIQESSRNAVDIGE